MLIILCHTTADFDAVGAAVGLTCLIKGAKFVLTGGAHPQVKQFLSLYRDEYAIIESRSVNPKQITDLIIVDTQQRSRLGFCAQWLDLPQLNSITVYDHHFTDEVSTSSSNQINLIPTTNKYIEKVGAITTVIVEALQKEDIKLTPAIATVMALGIHVDTGSLTYTQTTTRDILALAYLMSQGANLEVIRAYLEPGLTPELRDLLPKAQTELKTVNLQGYQIGWLLLHLTHYISGLSSLAGELIDITGLNGLLLAASYPLKESNDYQVTVVGRCRVKDVDLQPLFTKWGGGGHSQAASLNIRHSSPESFIAQLWQDFLAKIPQPITAKELMSSPVRTIRPQLSIAQAQRILLRYGHSGLCVVTENPPELVGIISRRDLDLALHHGFAHAPVKGYMKTNLKTITPDTTLPEIEALMVTYDIGRLPVLAEGKILGIVTRTDVLRYRYHGNFNQNYLEVNNIISKDGNSYSLIKSIKEALLPKSAEILQEIANLATKKGWQLYLVGGGVRDILLSSVHSSLFKQKKPRGFNLQDIDLVVDGCVDQAAVELAQIIHQCYPGSRLEIHGRFQTASLSWHNDPIMDSVWIDIATARTEFYPYPAANPEVEASSIKQDLYRRDFTINALAVRLTTPRNGELLDFFGGLCDVEERLIRVLHPNSFIEDPTRIFRAVRFAVRLGFTIESATRNYIDYAIGSGIYDLQKNQQQPAPALQTRLKAELKYILQEDYWLNALELLEEMKALACLTKELKLTNRLRDRLRLGNRLITYLELRNNVQLPPLWLMRLEILLSDLPSEISSSVANNLQLPETSYLRLLSKDRDRQWLEVELREQLTISQMVEKLAKIEWGNLYLILLQTDRYTRGIIWQYLTCWSKIRSPLDGNDLKQLGYKQGRHFKKILTDLWKATLDGKISNRAEAIGYLKNLPTPPP